MLANHRTALAEKEDQIRNLNDFQTQQERQLNVLKDDYKRKLKESQSEQTQLRDSL